MAAHFTEDRLCEALDAYRRVLDDPSSSWYDKALYKVAWTHYRLDRFGAAYKRFIELIDYADKAQGRARAAQTFGQALQYVAVAAVEQGWGARRPARRSINVRRSWRKMSCMTSVKLRSWMSTTPRGSPRQRSPQATASQMFAAVGAPYQREVYLEVAKVLFDQAAWQKYVPIAKRVIELDPMHPENPNVAMNIIAAYDKLRSQKLAEGAAARGAVHHIRTGHRVAGGEQGLDRR